MEKKRSKGVTLLGCFFIFGIFNLITNARILLSFDTTCEKLVGLGATVDPAQFKVQLWFGILMTIPTVVSGVLILMLKEPGRRIALWTSGIIVFTILANFILSLSNQNLFPSSFISIIVAILFNGFVIYFFTRPKVKEQFVKDEGAKP